MMLRRFACKYNTRDIVEEYRSIPVLAYRWVGSDRRRLGCRHRQHPVP
jgi:hypothetical protein